MSDILKKLRRKAGLTQTQTAVLAGVNLRTYAEWERGSRPAPAAAEAYLITTLRDMTTQLRLKKVEHFRQSDGSTADGYACYLQDGGADEFLWFVPVEDGMISEHIFSKIYEAEKKYSVSVKFD